MARKFIVTLAVVDLRAEPTHLPLNDFSHNDLRLSQLLYNEKLELIEPKEEWLKVGALEQPCFNEAKGWHAYEGWVHRSEVKEVSSFPKFNYVVHKPSPSLAYGTYLSSPTSLTQIRKIPTQLDREQIVQDVELFLDSPYFWGGRGFYVDCSSLIQLLYRAQGIIIPRDAYDQYLKSYPVPQLQPGDPLFLAKETRINHLILKLNGDYFIESPETGKKVRLLRWGKDLWEKQGCIEFSDRSGLYTPYPRSLL